MLESEDEVDTGASASATASALDLGERLRSARQARTLSVEQVAEALRLDESVIQALEDGDCEALGAAVFMRGHLKAYARLLGLQIDDVLDSYPDADPGTVTVAVVPPQTDRHMSINPVIFGVSGLGVVVTLILALYVMQDDQMPPVPVSDRVEEPVDLPLPLEPPPVISRNIPIESGERSAIELDFNVAQPADTRASDPQVAVSFADDEVPQADSEDTAVLPRPTQIRLSLLFKQESWVEISDANRRLLFGLQHEGRRRELTGEPPFQLLLGNASGVELTVNDQPYTLPTNGLRGNVARFEIASGAAE